ncbi:thiamine pyrophosphate-binding protein [Micrococcoides hystricis]|uniref:Thiamine pyrophosphate-binding protein n=1 Tax=Micrococcoides hystricis TaxID=1572761 RepID=A0ABV6P8G1_9MICC
MKTISAVVADVVAEYTTEVFALMGNGNAYFSDALLRAGRVTVTAVRHETATVASADAYYRASRKIAVATTTYGPGYTNALTSLAEAAMSGTPLVFVVGSQPSAGPRPWDIDQAVLAETVGARTITLTAEDPSRSTHRAFAMAEEESLPVVLFIPHDLGAAPAPENEPEFVAEEPESTDISSAHIQEFLQPLSQAKRPLILAGRGARAVATELGELADHLGALSVATAPARGIFSGRPYDLGVVGGFASEASSALIKSADVVLVVGAGLNQFTTAFTTQFNDTVTLLQIDRLSEPTSPLVQHFLSAEAEQAVPALLSAVREQVPAHTGERWDSDGEVARDSRITFEREQGTGSAPDGRLDPRSAMVRLNEILPQDRQVISDGGHFIGWAAYYFDLPQTDSLLLVGTQFQSIGLGFPSALGALRARPGVTSILVTGDGGGLMGLPDLDSVVRLADSAVVLVFNDAAYGAEIHQYGSQGLDETIMNIDQIDFAKLADGFGAQGVVVNTMADLDHVQSWVEEGARGTLIVDLRISRTVVAPYIEEIVELTIKK